MDTALDKLGFAIQELGQIEGDLEEQGLKELAEQTASLKYEINKEYERQQLIEGASK